MSSPDAPVRRVTFKATSNKVTLNKLWGDSLTLREAIATNDAFTRAFNPEEGDGPRHNAPKSNKPAPTIIQSSTSSGPVRPARYGLVSSIMDAYNAHHSLVLRPDDVWQAVLTQFSFYVNKNAEELRDCFVDFKGKKTLVIHMGGTLFSADFAEFANRMVDEKITTNIKDPSMAEWLIPKFTTTKTGDRVAASVTIMSTLQAYFEFVCCLMCGIPQVTLEGTVEDWRQLRAKIDRLPEFEVKGSGKPVMRMWHKLLAKVLDKFVESADGKADLGFWDTVCHHSGGGSGPRYLSGWVTVFSCFTAKGEWQGGDGSTWPRIDTNRIPVGAVAVPVLVDDNGTQYDTQMVAGQFAFDVEGADTIRPRTDWCIAYEGKPKEEPRAYKDGEVRP